MRGTFLLLFQAFAKRRPFLCSFRLHWMQTFLSMFISGVCLSVSAMYGAIDKRRPKQAKPMTKNTDERTMRLAKRNALISALFYELTAREGCSFMQAYVFLEGIFGLNDCQIRRILRQKSKVVLSTDDLTKLAVILHRLSNKKESEKAYGISRSFERSEKSIRCSRSLSFRRKAKKKKEAKKKNLKCTKGCYVLRV